MKQPCLQSLRTALGAPLCDLASNQEKRWLQNLAPTRFSPEPGSLNVVAKQTTSTDGHAHALTSRSTIAPGRQHPERCRYGILAIVRRHDVGIAATPHGRAGDARLSAATNHGRRRVPQRTVASWNAKLAFMQRSAGGARWREAIAAESTSAQGTPPCRALSGSTHRGRSYYSLAGAILDMASEVPLCGASLRESWHRRETRPEVPGELAIWRVRGVINVRSFPGWDASLETRALRRKPPTLRGAPA